MMQFQIRAAYRLRATDRTEVGQKLYKEMSQYLQGLKFSRVDGTIQVPQGRRPIQFVLRRLGFSWENTNPTHYERSDMALEVRRPHEDWDDVIHIIPH